MKNVFAWVKSNFWYLFTYFIFMSGFTYMLFEFDKYTKPAEIKEFKDGIQNHLVWSIKGECFFVRPHTETTVYLIRVADCDRK